MNTKHRRIFALCLLVTMLVSAQSLAAPLTGNTLVIPRGMSTGAHAANPLVPGKSPITGLDWEGDYRPLVVQISNSKEARPHWNLSEADIVYESLLWGPSHTRYTAIFSDNHPAMVGAVRSARINHCEIRHEWDAPIVFFGGQDATGTSIYDFFKENSVSNDFRFDGTRSGKGLTRVTTRVSPHNAIANLEAISGEYWPNNADGTPYVPKQHILRFSETPTRGMDTATEIRIDYDFSTTREYNPYYIFNPTLRVYERGYDGEAQVDGETGKRIVAANVIVQFAATSFFQGQPSRPVIEMVGAGPMDFFSDGQHVRGTWERKTLNDRTVYMGPTGEELTLLPGKTFIQVIPTSMTYSYTRADGSIAEANVGYEVPGVFMLEDTSDPSALDEMADK